MRLRFKGIPLNTTRTLRLEKFLLAQHRTGRGAPALGAAAQSTDIETRQAASRLLQSLPQ